MDELLYLTQDSLYVRCSDGSIFPNLPWPTGQVEAAIFAGLVVGVGSAWENQEPLVLWGTRDSLHARLISGDQELPGWPVEVGDDRAYSPPSLLREGEDWKVFVCDDTLQFGWDQNGNLLPGYPYHPHEYTSRREGRPHDMILGDLMGDGRPVLLKRFLTRHIYGNTLEGIRLEDFPVSASLSGISQAGSAEPVTILRTVNADSAYFFTMSYHSETNQLYGFHYTKLYGYPFVELMDGFPVVNPMLFEPFTNSNAPCALIPGENDTLHIVYFQSEGFLAVYDLYMGDTGGMILEWPMPGNTAGGNRLYNPVRVSSYAEEFENGAFPQTIRIGNPYPNPFNSSTSLSVTIPFPGAWVSVTDMLGRQVHSEWPTSNRQLWNWGTVNQQNPSSGTYFIRLQAQGGEQVERKVTLLK